MKLFNIFGGIKSALIALAGFGAFILYYIFHRRGDQRDEALRQRDSAQRSTETVQRSREKERDIAQAQAHVREKNATARQKRNETPDSERFTGRTSLNDRLRDDDN